MLTQEKVLKKNTWVKQAQRTTDQIAKVENERKRLTRLIEAKKIKKEASAGLRPFITSISLLLSLALVIMAFEWRSADNNNALSLGTVSNSDFELIEVPLTNQPPPTPQKIMVQPNIVEVEEQEEILEDIVIHFDVDVTTAAVEVPEMTFQSEPEEETDQVFLIVEDKPSPIGGMDNFMKYLYTNITYPAQALRARVEGRVYIQFVVDKDGSLSDIKVVKGIGMGCDEEALRVIKSAPAWHPGKQRGVPVRVQMVVPIQFVCKDPD